MFNKYLSKTNQKAVEYFETLFKMHNEGKKNIPNSIILWGSDSLAQYFFALEIARALNCEKSKEIGCDCLNCRWIYKNTHPAITTVSKINSKPSGDETKNISVRQVNELLLEVDKKSSDYRVIIFCDADMEKLTDEQLKHLENYEELKDALYCEESKTGKKYWIPKPLNSKVMQEESANSLLKTIEETPKNLTFIFLTASPSDLIPTIISRSQMFYVQNTFNKTYDFTFPRQIFDNYPNINKAGFDNFTQNVLKFMKENEIELFDFLETAQAYFTELLKMNYQEPVLRGKILKTIQFIIQAKKYKLSSIKDEYILDDLWLNITD